MMRTEGFAVGSSWREGRERDRRGDNASSSIETRVLSPLALSLCSRKLAKFLERGKGKRFSPATAPSLCFSSPCERRRGKEAARETFFFSSVGSREKSDLFEKKFIRVQDNFSRILSSFLMGGKNTVFSKKR